MRLTELAGAGARCLDVISAMAELEDAAFCTLTAARDAVQRELVKRAPGHAERHGSN